MTPAARVPHALGIARVPHDPTAALLDYLAEVTDRPFAWGRHDCFTFTNEARRRMTGRGWGDDIAGRYLTPRGRLRRASAVRRATGAESIRAALDKRLTPVPHLPPRGAVVITDAHVDSRWPGRHSMGIAVGTSAAFVAEAGLVYLPIDRIAGAWD